MSAFLALFALDVFSENQGLTVVLPLLIHLLPALVLLGVAMVAWRWAWVGAVVYPVLAALYVVLVGFDRPISWYLAISGPLAVLGGLYWASWKQLPK